MNDRTMRRNLDTYRQRFKCPIDCGAGEARNRSLRLMGVSRSFAVVLLSARRCVPTSTCHSLLCTTLTTASTAGAAGAITTDIDHPQNRCLRYAQKYRTICRKKVMLFMTAHRRSGGCKCLTWKARLGNLFRINDLSMAQ